GEVTEPLLESNEVRKITFTGSTEIGKELANKATNTMKRISMELGGHAPYIVFEDANLKAAVEGALTIKFGCAGQQCTSVNRFYVHEKIYDEFVELYKAATSKLVVQDGLSESTDVGPLINEKAIEKVQE